jgi:hypothetical protein
MKTRSRFVFRSTLTASAVVAALIGFYPIQARADTIGLTFTGGSSGGNGFDVVGWAFVLSDPLLVTQLGVWDSTGSGLSISHTVTIWTDPTGTPLAQATVPSGPGPETNNFRYVTLTTPVLLAPGNYAIGDFSPAFGDSIVIEAATITTASGVTYNGSRSDFSMGNVFPSGDAGNTTNSYFGPNFQFVSPTTSVPDSGSTWILLLLGLTVPFGLKRVIRQPL